MRKLYISVAMAVGYVIGPAIANACEINNSAAFAALANTDDAHILLIRHDETDNGKKRRPVDVRSDYGGLNQNCIQNHRHLLTGDRSQKMRQTLNDKGIKVGRVYHSEACRAEETAYHLGFMPRDVQTKINPGTGSAAEAWIKQLSLAKDKITVLVSHSEVLPPLLKALDPSVSSDNYAALKNHISSSDGHANGVVLRKTTNGFQCVAVTDLGI